MQVSEKLRSGKATTGEALAIYDALETVNLDFMVGAWKGKGFHTDHPLDGVLEAYHWHGKRFETPERVHPLVFRRRDGRLTNVNPIFMAPTLNLIERLPVPKSSLAGRTFQSLLSLFATTQPKAKLRMTTYRGKSSATMIYDQLPIHDVFRKIDERSVLGIMNLKGMKTPFFFILEREGEK